MSGKRPSSVRGCGSYPHVFVALGMIAILLMCVTPCIGSTNNFKDDMDAIRHEGNESMGVKEEEASLGSKGGDLATSVPESDSIKKAQDLYDRAIELRRMSDPSKEDLKTAVHLLYAAAGVVHLSMNLTKSGYLDRQYDSERGLVVDARFFTADDVDLRWKDGVIGHLDAVKELIYVFRTGEGAPYNPAIAHRLVKELARHGVAEFQADMGTFYSLGLEPVAPNEYGNLFILKEQDHDLSMLHLTFAAKSGDATARMALGFRHLHGLGVERSCASALLYYEPVAASVLEAAQINGGLPRTGKRRLGEKRERKESLISEEHEYFHYKWFADYGHPEAARAVAHLLTHGTDPDLDAAIDYLRQAAGMGDASSMAHLGHAYASGIAVEQNNATARRWFLKAAERGSPSGLLGLGIMYLMGQGVDIDYVVAAKYLRKAIDADQDWSGLSDAYLYLGILNLNGWGVPKNVDEAVVCFSSASKGGNLLASYNLAMLYMQGIVGERTDACEDAAALLKKVAERGWASLAEAQKDFRNGEYDWSLYNYLKAADIGVELAQANAAWMLKEGYGYQGPLHHETETRMLRFSVSQGNREALVPLGDSYWYGTGVNRSYERAAKAYSLAGKGNIAQALFNMGYLHQYGIGVSQDFHIAKRYYDRASQASKDAFLPVFFALAWLKVHVFWSGVSVHLPSHFVRVLDPLFNFHGDSEMEIMHPAYSSSSWLASLKQSLVMFKIGNLFDAIEEHLDGMLILWLAGLLGLVLWRRNARRLQNVTGGRE